MGIGQAIIDAARGVATGERVDGELIKGLHPYRRLMTHIMRGRNESVVYFDSFARCDTLLKYMKEASAAFDQEVDITHCLVAAVAIALAENPMMNRFVVGRRLYQRKGRFITFSMKRQKLGRKAKLSAVKLEMPEGETFRQLVERINANIHHERSGKKTTADKEFAILDRLPRAALDGAVGLLKTLDHWGALPAMFIDNDAMYTSLFIANLGSLGMGAGFHHLYEWGNCPLFMMAGKIEKRPLVVGDQVEITSVIPFRYTFDERVDDGLNAGFGIDAANRALEDPYRYFGCLAADGSDARSLSQGAE
jgi:hypothetical protein